LRERSTPPPPRHGTYSGLATHHLPPTAPTRRSSDLVASISNASGTEGLATGASTGATNITASSGAVTSAPAVLTVTAATLVSIAVATPAASIAKTTTQQFAATGTYTDISTHDLTTTA